MKKTLIAILLALPSISNARYSMNQILSKIDKGNVAFVQSPIMTLDSPTSTFEDRQAFIDQAIKVQSMKYKNFKPNMWFYHGLMDGNTMHIIYYAWTENRCVYTYVEIPKGGGLVKGENITQLKSNSNGEIVDSHAESISMRYCEKLYNFYAK